jgi:hypothetical protein
VTASWQIFEKQVGDIFRLKGLLPTHDVTFAGRQHDLVLASDDEATLPVLVECKYHEASADGAVSVEELEDFAARVLRLRSSGDVSAGYLVTNTRFTRTAAGALYGRSESKFVFMRTVQELRRGLVNFDRYLVRLVSEYEASGLEGTFQPLQVSGARSELTTDAITALRGFATSLKPSLCVMTGDYGTGKTTICRRLAYLLAKDVRAGSPTRIPIYIPLKWYGQAGGTGALLQRFLDEQALNSATVDGLLSMHAAGQLLFIMDGFDEMLRRASGQSRRETIQDLAELCSRGTKMILTGRPGYFLDEAELDSPFGGVGISGVGERLRRIALEPTKPAKGWQRIQLQPLQPDQVEPYLERKLVGTLKSRQVQARSIVKTIRTTYNLADLAKRPILLDMMADTLGRSGIESIVTPAQLYRSYVDAWLDIDAEKGAFRSLLSAEKRLALSIALAWILQDQQVQEIHWKDLQGLVGKFFSLEDADDIDHFSGDVRTSTFLQRDERGYFRFAHLSFQEYFCARFLVEPARELTTLLKGILEEPEVSLAALAERSSAMLDFVGDMIGCPVNPYFWRSIRDGVAGQQERIEKAARRLTIDLPASSLAMLVQMADGDGMAFELAEMAFAYGETYRGLQEVIRSMLAEHNEPWLRELLDDLECGRLVAQRT